MFRSKMLLVTLIAELEMEKMTPPYKATLSTKEDLKTSSSAIDR